MAVRIRMKKMGRAHRPFYRICATDQRAPRDGRVLEELGTYDTSVADTDARAILKTDRIDYWLSVGAQPSEKVAVLIKKYGSAGTHKQQQESALQRLAEPKTVPSPGAPASMPEKLEEPAPEAASSEEAKSEAPTEEAAAPETAEVAAKSTEAETSEPATSSEEEASKPSE